VRQWFAVQREEPPGYAPAVFAKLRLAACEVDTCLVPVADAPVGIGGVDRHRHLIEFRSIAVSALDGRQRTIEQGFSLPGIQHSSAR